MDKQLIFKLKEFYTLETFQVAFYDAQVNSATDQYYKRAFQKMVQMEQNHANFFSSIIERAGETLPSFFGSTFNLAGKFLGEGVETNGQHDTCTLGVKLEQKAMKMYQEFIDQCKQKKYVVIENMLMEFLLEEEFHTLWLNDYAKKHPN